MDVKCQIDGKLYAYFGAFYILAGLLGFGKQRYLYMAILYI